jgi:hypothetical protein
MYGSMLRVCWDISKSENKNTPPDISTHSVGDGTDNIVRLRTICGNLFESVLLGEKPD